MADTGKTIALIKALGGSADPAVIEQATQDWLDDHPEATTTVQDGSITKAKLDSNLQGTVDDVDELKSALTNIDENAVIRGLLNGWDSVNWTTGYINGNGTVSSNTSFRSSDFIPVSAGNTIAYKLYGYDTLVWVITAYDSTKTRIAADSLRGESAWKTGTYTVAAGTAFVRICSGSTDNSAFSSDAVNGTKITSTKDYVESVTAPIASQVEAMQSDVDELSGMLPIKDNFVLSPNLLDPTKTVAAPGLGTGYVYTDYMPVTAGKRYTLWADGAVYGLYWYNSGKTQISTETISGKGIERVAPTNAVYARLSYNTTNVTKVMFAEGVVGDYVPYGAYTAEQDLPMYVVRDTNNLNDEHKYVNNCNISTQTGNIITYNSSRVSDFIPVEEGETYYVGEFDGKQVNKTGAAAYNASLEFVETISTFPYTVPEGVAYIRIAYSTPSNTYCAPCVRKGNTGVSGIEGFNSYDTFRIVHAKPTEYEQENGLYGLMWNAMGDSITEGSGSTKTYIQYIAERTGVRKRNYGESNTAIARRGESYTNDMCMRYSSMDNDADIITVFGGTNDHGNNIPIGEWGDATEYTLYGAMKILVEGLINKYMGKKIGFITPLPKYNTSNSTDYSYPSASFKPYIDCIKDVCMRYSIPVLDLYTESGISPSMSTVRTAMIPDGLHPNALGHEQISWKIQRFLERL